MNINPAELATWIHKPAVQIDLFLAVLTIITVVVMTAGGRRTTPVAQDRKS